MTNAIYLDLRVGGLGDQWMRLVSFSATASLCPEISIHIHSNPLVATFATAVFKGRLEFSQQGGPNFRKYTTLGIRHLAQDIVAGERFVSPYARVVMHDQGYSKFNLKRIANSTLYAAADALGLILVPPASSIDLYQGYAEVLACKEFRHIDYRQFVAEISRQVLPIRQLMNSEVESAERRDRFREQLTRIIVFPSGTSRTAMPAAWAKRYFPEEWFAFHRSDSLAAEYRTIGLKTVAFDTPEDIAYLGAHASHCLSTDSFPSHILQYATDNVSILITEAAPSRIISPAFRGKVVEAVAPCHPCLKMAKGSFEYCQAGYKDCLNWFDDQYGSDAVTKVGRPTKPSVAAQF